MALVCQDNLTAFIPHQFCLDKRIIFIVGNPAICYETGISACGNAQ